MLTNLMKCVSILALLLGVFLTSSASFRVGLEMVVCVAGLVVAAQAFRIGKYVWGISFTIIAMFFNPVVPIVLPRNAFLPLDLVCIGAFLTSLTALQWRPIPSIPSITGRTPGSESL